MTTAQETSIQLTTTPETVEWPEKHYVFVERIGPFMANASQAWKQLHQNLAEVERASTVTGYFSLYQVGPQIYRAGVAVAAEPASLPDGLRYEKFEGGKYSRFTLTGSYAQLPEACGRAFRMAEELELPLREGWNIEHYANDPRTTPESELITEILFPIA
jgi:predicted transcriptional regulator YdeE